MGSARDLEPLLLALVLAATGCAAASAGPRGPLQGRGVEVAMDLSNAYAPATATLTDGSSSRGGGDNYWNNWTLLPRRAEARISPVAWADIGGRIGWLEGELDLRVGVPVRDDSPLAFNLAAGLSSGEAGPFKDTKGTSTTWVRLEAYPRLLVPVSDGRLVLAAGIDRGRFFHELADPRPQPMFGGVDSFGPSLLVLRRETRLETSVGVFLPMRHSRSLLVTLSPYFVLDRDGPEATCKPADCGAFYVARYEGDWGIVLVARLAIRHAL